MKKVLFVVVGLFLVLGFQPLAFAQPSIDGDWLFDISGTDQGGALITFVGAGFNGYGFARDTQAFTITGNHAVNPKGEITGTYQVFDELHSLIHSGTITGKVDKKGTKISLKFSDGPNAKGIKVPSDPAIPESWLISGTGQGGGRVTFDPVTIMKDSNYSSRVYSITGTGFMNGDQPLLLEAGFFLTSKSVAYGAYQVYDGSQNLVEEGFFTGKVNLSSNKLNFKLTSTEGAKGVMRGVVAPAP